MSTPAKRARQNKWVKAQRKRVPLEAALEHWTVEYVERVLGGWCPKVGLRGWPDRLVILGHGQHVWLEFKRRKFGHLTPAQKRLIPKLRAAGEPVYVVKTKDEVELALTQEVSP